MHSVEWIVLGLSSGSSFGRRKLGSGRGRLCSRWEADDEADGNCAHAFIVPGGECAHAFIVPIGELAEAKSAPTRATLGGSEAIVDVSDNHQKNNHHTKKPLQLV